MRSRRQALQEFMTKEQTATPRPKLLPSPTANQGHATPADRRPAGSKH